MRITGLLLGVAMAIGLVFFLYGKLGGNVPVETEQALPSGQEQASTAAAVEKAPETPTPSAMHEAMPGQAEKTPDATVQPADAPTGGAVWHTEAQPVETASLQTRLAPENTEGAIMEQTLLPPQDKIKPAQASIVPVSQPETKAAIEKAGPAQAPAETIPPPKAPAAVAKKASARDLFAAVKEPANLATRSIGFYAHGCLAGAKPLPIDGPAWQVMRLSRNRNWGHPTLIAYIERLAEDAKQKDGWPGLLIGDLSMPRGGPMPFGHSSHQVGLDADIWYKPEPNRELTPAERENVKMESFLLDPGHVNPAVWKPDYEKLLRRAVSYPEVTRIFVNPAIKKWLCDNAKGDRSFLHKITPIMGHDDHFHVRLVCPAGDTACQGQPPVHADEGCGKGLDHWIESLMKAAKQPAPTPVAASTPVPATLPFHGLAAKIRSWKRKAAALHRRPPITMAQLPADCEKVLEAAPAVSTPVTAAR